MHGHHKKPHYRAKSPSPKVSPFSEHRLEPSLASQLLIRVVTLLFFHSGAIYHVHRKHGALTRNLSTNTATADNLKHTSDPKTLSFTRNDPLRTSVPSRGWGARSGCISQHKQGYVVLPEERLSWKTEGRSSAGRGNAGELRDQISRGYGVSYK